MLRKKARLRSKKIEMAAGDLVREGNEAFVDDDYELAVKKYSDAIELNAYDAEFYLKRAAAFMKLKNYQAAVEDASSAVSLEPENCKAHTRKGIALSNLENFTAAKEAFSDALKLDRENKELQTWIRKCDAELDLAANEAKVGTNSTEMVVVDMASGDESADAACNANSQTSINKATSTSTDSSTSANDPPSVSTVTDLSNQEQPQANPVAPQPRFDWYQTETHVIIALMIKNTKKESVNVEYGDKTLSATVKLPSGSDFSLELDLAQDIVPAQSKTRLMSSKVELKMKKAEEIRWSSLEADNEIAFPTKEKTKSSHDTTTVHKYPSSRHVGKDWDKVAAQIAKEEKDEKLEGEAALNHLFQEIYGDGSDEVRKAMNKSFVESGGTVLSTNWDEVKQKSVDCKPPDGMEWKEWSK